MQVIKMIRNVCESSSLPTYVFFSGGKDSLASLLLTWLADINFKVVFAVMPDNTHPLCIEYVRKICEEHGVDLIMLERLEYGNFWKCIERWGLPHPHVLWCWRIFKHDVFKILEPCIKIVGVRKSESLARTKRYKESVVCRGKEGICIYPILNWSEERTLSFIKKMKVSLNPCYGFAKDSLSCVFCPKRSADKIKAIMTAPQCKYFKEKIVETLQKVKATSNYSKAVKRMWLKWKDQSTLCQIQEK